MPPKKNSRYLFSLGMFDAQERTFLTERIPFRFKEFRDNRSHVAAEGDTLQTLAGFYFRPLERSSGYWWVIGDFQPDPIVDPTLQLDIGRTVFVPSLRTLREEILSEKRRWL